MKNLEPGHQFGRYRIEGLLGEGGFARVYAAVALTSGGLVALKVLKGPISPTDRARFAREARIAARLRSPHVPKLVEFGECDGHPFAAFEIVGGEDLSEVLARSDRMDERTVRSILLQLLDALEDAHRAGLVHRDIKPENIRVVPDPARRGELHAVLMDFGIARATDGGHPSVTRTGELIGTPRYMSPEQLTSERLTPASDLYSLGLVVFEMLAGRNALPDSSLGAQLDRLTEGHVFDSPALAGVDPVLIDVMRKMTALRPARRCRSAAAVTAALRGEPLVEAPDRRAALPPAAWAIIGVAAVAVGAGVMAFGKPAPEPAVRKLSSPGGLALVRGPGEAAGIDQPLAVADASDAGGRDAAEAGAASLTPDWGTSRCGKPQDWGPVTARELRRFVPTRYDPSTRYPLVLALHGDLEGAGQFVHEANFDRVAESAGFIFLAPYGGEVPWEDPAAAREQVVGAIRLANESACIDLERIYLIGNREGAFPALQLACEPWVRALAVAHIGLPTSHEHLLSCATPAPTIWFQPSLAPRAPRNGGRDCEGEHRLPLATVVDSFLERGHCEAKPRIDRSADAGVCEIYECATAFQLCDVEGGPFWPGQGKRSAGWSALVQVLAPGCEMGRDTTFPMLDVTWRFFAAQPPRTP